jgi:hypothetical protein
MRHSGGGEGEMRFGLLTALALALTAAAQQTNQTTPAQVNAALDVWQRRNGITITSEARQLIQTGVNEAQPILNRLEAAHNKARPPASSNLLTELIRHYCFDLRDAKVYKPIASLRVPMARAFQKATIQPPTTLEARDVSIRPFPRFAAQFDDGKPKSYLDLSSHPTFADVQIDNNTIGFTDRSAVVDAGSHSVRISLSAAGLNCKRDVRLNAGARSAVSCPQ